MPRIPTVRDNPEFIGHVQRLREQGLSWRQITSRLGIGKSTYYRIAAQIDQLAESLPAAARRAGRPPLSRMGAMAR